MTTQTHSRVPWSHTVALPALLACAFSVAAADEPRQTIADPGYRPDSYWTSDFVEALDEATIAVLPTLIRRSERTAHSFASQAQIVAYLNDREIAARAKPMRIDMGPARRPSQWEIFEYGAGMVAETIKGYETGTDYALVMEILVPNSQAVFGIEIYLVDTDGKHLLSFLLNEHHRMFAEARLKARNSSEAARSEMIASATAVGMTAFERQLQQLRECISDGCAKPSPGY